MALAGGYLQLFTGAPCVEAQRVGCRIGLLACSSFPAAVKCAADETPNKKPFCRFYMRQACIDARNSRLLVEPFKWKKRLHRYDVQLFTHRTRFATATRGCICWFTHVVCGGEGGSVWRVVGIAMLEFNRYLFSAVLVVPNCLFTHHR